MLMCNIKDYILNVHTTLGIFLQFFICTEKKVDLNHLIDQLISIITTDLNHTLCYLIAWQF
jgi:hypothetical protein